MKKLLGSVLAIAMLVQPGFANAELLKNFKLSGSVDLQSQASRNVLDFTTREDAKASLNGAGAANAAIERPTFNDRLNDAQFRVIVNLDWDLLDDVHAKITLTKNDRAWGTNGGTAQSALYGATARQSLGTAAAGYNGGANVFAAVDVQQAYVKVDKVFGNLDATIGRQFFGEPGSPIIYFGPKANLYGEPVDAIDAARVDFNGAPYVNITGLAGKTVGSALYTATVNSGSGVNTDVRGFNISLKDVENISFDAFVWNQLQHRTGALGFAGDDTLRAEASGMNDNLYVYGFKGKVNFGGFTGKVLFAKNNGENRVHPALNQDQNQNGAIAAVFGLGTDTMTPPDASYSGWAWTLDGEFKADVEDVASFTPWLHMGYGTGRNSLKEAQNAGFTAINSDYRPGTIYGRFGQFLGSGIPCVTGAVGCTPADIDGANGIDGLGTRTQGTHMGAANVGGVGLNNRVIWGLGLRTTPAFANKLEIAISWWQFRFQKVTDDNVTWISNNQWVYGAPNLTYACNATNCFAQLPDVGNPSGDGATTGYWNGDNNTRGFSNGRGNKHIGDELDFDLTWKHSDNVTFAAGVASFRPGKYLQSMIADNYNANGGTAGGNLAATGPGMRVSNNPVILAYGDMHIKF